MTPKQIYWISIEVFSLALCFGTAYLVGYEFDNRIETFVIALISVVLTSAASFIISSIGAVATYMSLVNASVFFLLSYGVFMLFGVAIVENFESHNNTHWIIANGISFILSFFVARYIFIRKRDDIEIFVNEHILEITDSNK